MVATSKGRGGANPGRVLTVVTSRWRDGLAITPGYQAHVHRNWRLRDVGSASMLAAVEMSDKRMKSSAAGKEPREDGHGGYGGGACLDAPGSSKPTDKSNGSDGKKRKKKAEDWSATDEFGPLSRLDCTGSSTVTMEDLNGLQSRGLLLERHCQLPLACEERLSFDRHQGAIMGICAWFEAGLCVPVHPFISELMQVYGFELAHLQPHGILRMNVFRWMCETFLGEAPSLRPFLHFFEMKLGIRKIGDGAGSVFGAVFVRLRGNKLDCYPLLPALSPNALLFKHWKQKWFYLFLEPSFHHTRALPKSGGSPFPSLKTVSPPDLSSQELEKVEKLMKVRSQHSVRDLLEEMFMAGCFKMKDDSQKHFGPYPSIRLPNRLAPEMTYEEAVTRVNQLIGPYDSNEHKLYEKVVRESEVHNRVAHYFKIKLSPRVDPAIGPQVILSDGTCLGRMGTCSREPVGSNKRNNLGAMPSNVVVLANKVSKPMPDEEGGPVSLPPSAGTKKRKRRPQRGRAATAATRENLATLHALAATAGEDLTTLHALPATPGEDSTTLHALPAAPGEDSTTLSGVGKVSEPKEECPVRTLKDSLDQVISGEIPLEAVCPPASPEQKELAEMVNKGLFEVRGILNGAPESGNKGAIDANESLPIPSLNLDYGSNEEECAIDANKSLPIPGLSLQYGSDEEECDASLEVDICGSSDSSSTSGFSSSSCSSSFGSLDTEAWLSSLEEMDDTCSGPAQVVQGVQMLVKRASKVPLLIKKMKSLKAACSDAYQKQSTVLDNLKDAKAKLEDETKRASNAEDKLLEAQTRAEQAEHDLKKVEDKVAVAKKTSDDWRVRATSVEEELKVTSKRANDLEEKLKNETDMVLRLEEELKTLREQTTAKKSLDTIQVEPPAEGGGDVAHTLLSDTGATSLINSHTQEVHSVLQMLQVSHLPHPSPGSNVREACQSLSRHVRQIGGAVQAYNLTVSALTLAAGVAAVIDKGDGWKGLLQARMTLSAKKLLKEEGDPLTKAALTFATARNPFKDAGAGRVASPLEDFSTVLASI